MKDLDEMKLARVIEAAGGIDGRVKMQKIVYLLTVMGYDLPFRDFVIRKQGPFSRAVSVSADLLTKGGFVEQTEKNRGDDSTGKPVVQYCYNLRESIAELVRNLFEVAAPLGKPGLEEVARFLKTKNRSVLEVAATRLYLEREEGLSGRALSTELGLLKGHLAGSFQEANELLEELKGKGWL
jgi:uncharacterized protein YwgA